MKTLAEKIKELKQTPYEIVAKRVDASADYVQKIATSARQPKSTKGKKVIQALEEYIDELKKQ